MAGLDDCSGLPNLNYSMIPHPHSSTQAAPLRGKNKLDSMVESAEEHKNLSPQPSFSSREAQEALQTTWLDTATHPRAEVFSMELFIGVLTKHVLNVPVSP